jgi:hypothetical protein
MSQRLIDREKLAAGRGVVAPADLRRYISSRHEPPSDQRTPYNRTGRGFLCCAAQRNGPLTFVAIFCAVPHQRTTYEPHVAHAVPQRSLASG